MDKTGQRIALGVEIAIYNALLFLSTFGVMIAMLMYRGKDPVVVQVLGVAWAFSLARFDYLIQRIGGFLRREELSQYNAEAANAKPRMTWEISPERKRSMWILVVSDIGCMLPNILMFLEANKTYYHSSADTATLFMVLFAIAIVLFSMISSNFKY